LRGKPGDGADDGRIRRDAERATHGRGGVPDTAEAIHLDAAADRGVLLRASDPQQQAFLDVSRGDGDHAVRPARDHPLHRHQDALLRHAHAFVEAPAVNGMDDHGHARQLRRHASEQPSLGAMRMHDVVAVALDQHVEIEQCASIVGRPDRVSQSGDQRQRNSTRPYLAL
jgi:hypothetical protein